MFRSSREKRIDRALSHVLCAIEIQYAEPLRQAETWRDLDELHIAAHNAAIAAYDRADRLRAQWRKRLSECDCCGEIKLDCRNVFVNYAGDTHACPACLGEAD